MKLSIYQKVNILFTGVILSTGFWIGFYSIRSETSALREELNQRADVLLNSLAISTEYPILIRNHSAISKLVHATLRQKDVAYCSVEDRNGDILVEAGTSESLSMYDISMDVVTAKIDPGLNEETLLAPTDSEENLMREAIGRVRIKVSLADLERRQKEITKTVAAVVLGSIVLALLASAALLNIILVRPIRHLLRGTEKIARGDLEHKVPVQTQDEIGVLAASFNQMTAQLQKTTVNRDYVDNILHSMINALIVVGMDGTIQTVNQATLDLLGYEEVELIGQPLDQIGESGFFKEVREELFNKGAIRNAEKIFLSKPGRKIPVFFSSALMGGQRESIEAVVCVAQDLSARKQAEEALAKSLSTLKATLEATADGILVVDKDGNIIAFNQRFTDLWNIPVDILKMNDDSKAISYVMNQLKEPETFVRKIRELYDQPQAQSFDILEFKDGRVIERYSMPQLIAGESSGRVWSFRDVTDRRRAEEEKERLQSHLRQADKIAAVGQLASGIAHEINNPLGVILGFAQSINRRIEMSNTLFVPLQAIEREAKRCKNLVHDLLTFSRVGKSEKEECSLQEVLQSSLTLIEAETKVKSVELTRTFNDSLGPVLVNRNQIQQIIVNLCNNAIDAMPEGGRLEVGLARVERQDRSFAEIRVADTGTGIPKDIQQRIFEPFFTTKDVGKGTGLGLSLVYEIVEKHQGTIELESAEGKGTVFRVLLPMHHSASMAKA